MKNVFEELAEEYPLIYLNPDEDSFETYRSVVLKGEEPLKKSLAHYHGNKSDKLETVETPVGSVRVATIGDRHDFELVIRGMMAAKNGPLTAISPSHGASMLTAINWTRIHAHLAKFPDEEQGVELKRFTSVKSNYIDKIVILSRGPYSNVAASDVGMEEEKWIEYSDTIRRYHELTHFISRQLYPENIEAIRDELIADAVGIYAAYGFFSPETEKLFLGIKGDEYLGGRLDIYTEEPEKMVERIVPALENMKKIINDLSPKDPFELIPVLIEECRI